MRDEAVLDQYHRDGYTVARGLFSATEAEGYRDHYMALRAGEHPLDHQGVDTADSDPLREYPRMTHMQRWDRTSLEWLTHPRLNRCMTQILGREPYAVQSMLYFKPPGSRGDIATPLPEGMARVPLVMEPGDVAFFTGALIHGSFPNASKDRFRRALAGHYVAGGAEKVSGYYHPVLRMDGTEVELGTSEGGGPCGVWVDADGMPEVEMRPVGAWQPNMQGIAEASTK